MPLVVAQKAGIRRHLKFAVAGLERTSPSGGTLASGAAGYRWNQAFGALEYRMNNLSPTEEAMLLGIAYGAVALTGPLQDGAGHTVPAVGDTISVTFSGGNLGSPHTVSYTAVLGDTLLSMATGLASVVNQDTTLQAAKIQSMAPFGTGPFAIGQIYPGGNPAGNLAIPVPEAAFICPVTFSVDSATSTGLEGIVVTADGGLMPPKAPVDYTQKPYGMVYGYLPICDALEGSWLGSTQNLDTAQAGGEMGWTARLSEKRDRKRLLYEARIEMRDFIFGLPSEGGLVVERSSGLRQGI